MPPRGRRDKIRRHLDYAAGILDKYMKHMLDSKVLVAGDNPEMDEQLEKLALYALQLQELTKQYRQTI